MLLDQHKGTRIDGHDTICGTIRGLYDRLVVGLTGKDDALLAEITPIIERAFLYGIKMNRRLCELKVDTMLMFPDATQEDAKLRAERIRLTSLIAQNDAVLAAHDRGEAVLKAKQ